MYMFEIYNNDCFEIFPSIEDKSVNLFLLDLPYANKKFGNCTSCAWDTPIDLQKMWIEIKRMMKPNAIIVFFCNTKFGYALINSNPKWFKYDLIYEKSRKVGFLSANKQPLRKHENIYIFTNNSITHSKKGNYGTYNPQKTEGEPYSVKGGKSKNVEGTFSRGHEVITEAYENKGERHPTSILPEFEEETHENIYIFKDKLGTYNPQKAQGKPYTCKQGQQSSLYGKEDTERVTTENNGLRHPTSILPEFEEETHENIYIFKKEQGTYNPQKTEGKPYKDDVRKKPKNCGAYGNEMIAKPVVNKGDRHPTSILPEFEEEHENIYIFKDKQGTYNPQMTPREKDYKHSGKRSSEEHYGNVTSCKKEYKKEDGMFPSTILKFNSPHKTIHRTQKPVDLLEWLIKTYSNENDLVMDFCMGSGSCGVACKNTNRKFIGIERDEDIFKLAQERLKKC